MSNQEEKKCVHDLGDGNWHNNNGRWEIKEDFPTCPYCEESEAKQEPKEYLLHNDSDVPLEVYPDFESARDAGIKKKREPMNIKTPEEIAWKILFCETCNGQGYTVQGETDRPEQVQCDVCYQGCKAEYKEIARLISEAISAERNANLETIKELKTELQIAWDKRKNYASEADELKSKLAESEKLTVELLAEIADKQRNWIPMSEIKLGDIMAPDVKAMENKIAKLEAEAKAVRSKTIEECAKVASCMENEFWDDGQYQTTDSGCKIAEAIRALNSGKEKS